MADYVETFNKADNGLGPVMTWVLQTSSTYAVVSNQAKSSTFSREYAREISHGITGDVAASLKLTATLDTFTAEIFAVAVDRAAGGGYLFGYTNGGLVICPSWPGPDDPGWFLTKFSSSFATGFGVDANLLDSDTSSAPGSGDVISLVITGTSIVGKKNATTICSVTNSDHPADSSFPGTLGRLYIPNTNTADDFTMSGTLATPDAPDAPVLSGELTAPHEVTLSWTTPDPGGGSLVSYNIYKGTVSSGETLLDNVLVGTNEYVDTDVVDGHHYFYYVTALNDV